MKSIGALAYMVHQLLPQKEDQSMGNEMKAKFKIFLGFLVSATIMTVTDTSWANPTRLGPLLARLVQHSGAPFQRITRGTRFVAGTTGVRSQSGFRLRNGRWVIGRNIREDIVEATEYGPVLRIQTSLATTNPGRNAFTGTLDDLDFNFQRGAPGSRVDVRLQESLIGSRYQIEETGALTGWGDDGLRFSRTVGNHIDSFPAPAMRSRATQFRIADSRGRDISQVSGFRLADDGSSLSLRVSGPSVRNGVDYGAFDEVLEFEIPPGLSGNHRIVSYDVLPNPSTPGLLDLHMVTDQGQHIRYSFNAYSEASTYSPNVVMRGFGPADEVVQLAMLRPQASRMPIPGQNAPVTNTAIENFFGNTH